jgi:Cysteine-rich CWC
MGLLLQRGLLLELTSICPLCGQANDCAMVEDPEGHRSCWCMSATFTQTARRRLQALDEQVCICARCASQSGDSAFLTEVGFSDKMPQ